MAEVTNEDRSAGSHRYTVDLGRFGLASASYVYQLEVRNTNGLYRNAKMMTKVK